MKNIIVALLACFLFGCAGSPYQLARMDQKQLSTVPNNQLLRALGNDAYRNDLMFAEAVNRGIYTQEEARLIKEEKIKIGMTKRILEASWGHPVKINRSVGSYGVHEQYVYGRYTKYSSPTFVYLENGKVTGWQN